MKSKTIQPVAMVLGTLFMALHPALASLPSDPAVSEERYPGQYHHVDSGGAIEDFIYLNGQKIGTLKEGTDLFFTISDHLGSSAVITNATGTVAEYRDYKPYGPQAAGQVPVNTGNDYLFTGKEQDPETSLQYFGARYYDNPQARFISTDPLLLNLHDDESMKQIANRGLSTFLTDPQQLNSYSYARNNPVIYTDPTGEVSTRAWALRPVSTAHQEIAWRSFAIGARLINFRLTASLLNRSLALDPSKELTITRANQKNYGSAVDQIINSSQYKGVINDAIANARNGQFNTAGSIKFEGFYDLATAIHKADFEIKASDEGSSWRFEVTFQDKYNYENLVPGTLSENPAAALDYGLVQINNQAYKSQEKEVITGYYIKINFNDERKK